LLADLASAEASVSAGGVKASGHLRVTAPAGFGRRHVAPLVPGFIAAHPDVSLSLNLSDRVVRTSSFTPSLSSRPSMRLPMTAGATPSACAEAVRLPLVATATNDSICLSRSMAPDYAYSTHKSKPFCMLNASAGIE
jgi:DNA-binding transcriptional LysR family regulator